jgi:large subunit ribosomal protein L37Ae
MAKRTKKVGVTGKYGTRYGSSIRKIVKKFELQQRAKYVCPACGKSQVRRTASGIWGCKGCKVTFAGGAFEFATSVATTAKVTMNRLKKLKEELNNNTKEEEVKDTKEVKKEKKAKAPKAPKA